MFKHYYFGYSCSCSFPNEVNVFNKSSLEIKKFFIDNVYVLIADVKYVGSDLNCCNILSLTFS